MFTKDHFEDIKSKAERISRDDVAEWLLNCGYYPDHTFLPPFFRISDFKLKQKEFFPFSKSRKGKWSKSSNLRWSDTEKIVFPKNEIMDRVFGIIHPDIYHDLVFTIMDNWEEIIEHIFKDRGIYFYSFPIPFVGEHESMLSVNRSERMIYEYIEMAEKDLVADAMGFNCVVHSDIKNFYPSVYTHSIAWALHGKEKIQSGKIGDYSFFGNKLDTLIQYGNGGATNGIPIGSAVSDLLAEIILAEVDYNISKELKKNNIEYVAVRFKDDYRFLCKTEHEGKIILKTLQKFLFYYNLSLNEDKTKILEFANALYRPWILEYNSFTVFKDGKSTFRNFEYVYFKTIKLNEKYPGTGILSKFLGELITDRYEINVIIPDPKHTLKFLNLIWKIRKLRIISLPQILGIIEILIKKHGLDKNIIKSLIEGEVLLLYDSLHSMGTYELFWFLYFLKSNNISYNGKKNPWKGSKNKIFKSLYQEKNFLFGKISKSNSKPKMIVGYTQTKRDYPLIIKWIELFKS